MKAKINSIKPIKFISFLLIFMLIFIPVSGMLTSCKTNQGNNTNNTTGTAAGPTDVSGDINAATEIQDSLPANLDFNGATLNLFTRGDCYVDNTVPEFGVETENGDIINDAIYNRDKVVEDRLNIKLNVIVGSGWQNYANDMTKIRASIAAGDQSYDLIAGWSASIPTLSIDGILMNLSDLPYVDFTQPWWNQRIVNDLTIDNKLNFAVGDGNLSLLCNCVAMFVNNTVQQAYGLPNIYDTVFAGKWTIDAMDQLARSVSKDLNGDGKIDKSDQVGCVMDNYNPFDGFMQGSDIQMITKDADGLPVLNIESDKLATLVDKIYNFSYNNPGVLVVVENSGDSANMFENDQALIVPGWLLWTANFRSMKSDYSIIPYPKFDESQDKYYGRIQDGVSLFCIPTNCDKADMVGAYMEANASESYKSVSSPYFDVAMKVKYARDETSAQMLDIIRGGAYLNFASVYNDSLGNPWFVMRTLLSAKSNKFASWLDQNQPKIQAALDKLVAKIEASQ